ncbi:MAG TPA: hypothetical protein VII73_13375 [Caulobacteraceae bacterium]
MADHGAWSPLSVEETARLMSELGAPWWIAGGWAIDLFLGRTTREHADIDVAILRRDQPALARLLGDWDVHVAADGVLTRWKAGDWLEGGARHQFFARPTPQSDWAVEILLEEARAGRWRYRRNRAVSLPLARFGRISGAGVPFVAPEVALLFKSNRIDEDKNRADFEAALPAMDEAARAWLKAALRLADPENLWIGRL